MQFPVRDLIEGRGLPLSVLPDTTLEHALSQMIAHSYTQLPVLQTDQRPLGLITTDSILRTISYFDTTLKDVRAKDALEDVERFRPDQDLFALLGALRDRFAVLIVNDDKTLLGIVTSYDAMDYFRRRAEDVMLVRAIESMVKKNIQAIFTDGSGQIDSARIQEAVQEITPSNKELRGRFRKALLEYLDLEGYEKKPINEQHLTQSFEHCLYERPKPKDFERLGFDEYCQIFLHRSRWPSIESAFAIR